MSYTNYFLGIPSLKNVDSLAEKMNLSVSTLYKYSNKVERFYRVKNIPKRTGGLRELQIPFTMLKAIQAWILRNILDQLPFEKSATAFVKKQNVRDNVLRHEDNQSFLCLDLKDFFPSISKKKVYNFFVSLGYDKKVAIMLTNFCCYNDGLPQGGVTSPALSNLINIRLDRRIAGYVGMRNITYTRYADDITLSSTNPRKLYRVRKVIKKIIMDEGYRINHKKTRILKPGVSRRITGLIINDTNHKFGIGLKQKKKIRAMMHQLFFKYNLGASNKELLLARINGWMSFLRVIDPLAYEQLLSFRKKLELKLGEPVNAAHEFFIKEAAVANETKND